MTTDKIEAIKEAWPIPERTHFEGCETIHYSCAIAVLLAALEDSERSHSELRNVALALREEIKFQGAELKAAKAEITAVLESLGPNAIRVRENGGPEDIYASLAVNVAKLSKLAIVRNDVIDEAIEWFTNESTHAADLRALHLEKDFKDSCQWAVNQLRAMKGKQ